MTVKKRPQLHYYGVANAKSGLIYFVSRNINHGYKEILIEESGLITSKEAHDRAKDLFDQYCNKSNKSNKSLKSGSVADHSDNIRIHRSIILDIHDQSVLALFVSSNPHWNSYSRLASSDELSIIGYHAKQISYLIPVVRSIEDFSTSDLTIPDYRLEELRKEFPWSVADGDHG